jgi:hypothetical protein
MLKAMQILLQEDLDIPKERIKIEEFTGYWYKYNDYVPLIN